MNEFGMLFVFGYFLIAIILCFTFSDRNDYHKNDPFRKAEESLIILLCLFWLPFLIFSILVTIFYYLFFQWKKK